MKNKLLKLNYTACLTIQNESHSVKLWFNLKNNKLFKDESYI